MRCGCRRTVNRGLLESSVRNMAHFGLLLLASGGGICAGSVLLLTRTLVARIAFPNCICIYSSLLTK
jgi:hypothetical protein